MGFVAACLGAAATVAWLNRHHLAQKGVYDTHYRALARYFEGGEAPAVLSYPMWGYPALLALLPAPEVTTIVLQVLLAVALASVVYATVAPMVRSRRLAQVLCVAALPLWSIASIKLADPWSVMLGAFGVFALARALASASARWALASGLCFGAALNFRSDWLLVLPLLPAVLALLAPRLAWARRRELLLAVAVALVAMVPWGLFRMAHGAPFGLSSSNGGMVLYNALGFAGNRWGIVGDDAYRIAEVREALGPDVPAHSVEGDAWLRDRAIALIRAHPEEYARKVVHDFVASVALGSYGIETEPLLQGDDALRFEVMKEQLKIRLGMAPNTLDIARFRRAGVWDESLSLGSLPARVWLAAGLRMANAAGTSAFLVAVLLASAWIVLVDRRWLARPEVVVLLAGLLASWGLVCAFWYQPRHTNVLYVLGAPLVVIAAEGVRVRLAVRRRRRREAQRLIRSFS
ncbi:MAG: hypothetical protein DCC71_19125 [Proteobacteria bacterium]|nr:MAG: hypothetical protein DCC71_19125 [Pseudomonadota bacterium]